MNTQNSTHSRQTVRETLSAGVATSNRDEQCKTQACADGDHNSCGDVAANCCECNCHIHLSASYRPTDKEPYELRGTKLSAWAAKHLLDISFDCIESGLRAQECSKGTTWDTLNTCILQNAQDVAHLAFQLHPELRVTEAQSIKLDSVYYYSKLILAYLPSLAMDAAHFRFWAQKSATYAFEAYPELREPCTQSEINHRVDREGRQRTARAEFDVLYPPRVQTGLTRVSGIPGFALLQAFLGRWNDMNPVPTADEAYMASLSEPVNDFSSHPLDSNAASQLARISGRKSAEWI